MELNKHKRWNGVVKMIDDKDYDYLLKEIESLYDIIDDIKAKIIDIEDKLLDKDCCE